MKNIDDSLLFKGKRLRLVRFYSGMSCQELADKIGCGKQAISKFETGLLKPSLITQIGLCKFFDLPEDFFTKNEITITCNGVKFLIAK